MSRKSREEDSVYHQYMYSYPHKTAYRTLPDLNIRDYLPRLIGAENSLYFHIPFCEAKCGYCNLFSVAGQQWAYTERYMDAMEEQLGQYPLEDAVFRDVTIGGGTPLYLETDQLERLFAIVDRGMGAVREYPVIMETSPNQTTEEKLEIAKAHYTQRISIGIQSFQPEELKRLCRIHTADQARKAVDTIRKQEFACMNLDLIYGIPGQTRESLGESLREALSYQPEELFIYPLYIKPGTVLANKREKPSENIRLYYEQVREYLLTHGYVQYSMRRFVREDYAVAVPAETCGFGNTLSLGCGGRSYLGNLHFCTPYYVRQTACKKQLDSYLETRDYTKITHGFLLDQEEEKRRYVIKNILFTSGLDVRKYGQVFHGELDQDFPILRLWQEEGYVYERNGIYQLTEEGMARSDALGPQLISENVRGLMREWENSFSTGAI